MGLLRPPLALILVVAALLSWWVAEQKEAPIPEPLSQQGPRMIDYYVNGLDVTRMTPTGIPAHRLKAEKLRHFADDDSTELEDPHLTVYQDDAPPWEVDAGQAWVSADGSLMLLTGDVLIEREAGVVNQPVRIITRDLRVQPRQDYAETDEKVRVESESNWLDAVGMQAWLRPPSRLKFLSQVKGYYVPR